MIVPVIYPSAAEFWLSSGPKRLVGYNFNHRNLFNLPDKFVLPISYRDAKKISVLSDLSLPLYVATYNKSQNRRQRNVICRYAGSTFPRGSFVTYNLENYALYIAIPELCFLQAARVLNLPELVKFGNDLCGQYYFLHQDNRDFTGELDFNGKKLRGNRGIIVTPDKIKAYITAAGSFFGVSKARRAVRYIVAGSNSPMESALAALIRMPIRLGGYGMPEFKLNFPIKLDDNAAAYMGTDMLRGDFVWPKKKLVLEYNGKDYHNDPNAAANDNNRMLVFQNSGYTAVGCGYENIKSFTAAEKFIENIRAILEQKADRESLRKFRDLRRENFRTLILPR